MHIHIFIIVCFNRSHAIAFIKHVQTLHIGLQSTRNIHGVRSFRVLLVYVHTYMNMMHVHV